jgi:hypothetical protein
MKQLLPAFSAILISVSCIFSTAAQNLSVADTDKNKDARLDYLIMQAASTSTKEIFISAVKRDTIPARAMKDFEKLYAGIADVRWEKTSEGNYLANFVNNDKTTLVVYNHIGAWMHTIFNYGADQLEQNVKTKIVTAYGGYKISYVDEVNATGYKIYLVHIENDTNIKTIKIIDNKMGEIQTLCKK